MNDTMASRILDILRPISIAACTLEYGYVVPHEGETVRFEPCKRVVSSVRYLGGRCKSMVCEYDDGSRLKFTYSADTGRAQYREVKP